MLIRVYQTKQLVHFITFQKTVISIVITLRTSDVVFCEWFIRLNYFYFGVLHPVARTLSRLLEEPSLVTTFLRCLFMCGEININKHLLVMKGNRIELVQDIVPSCRLIISRIVVVSNLLTALTWSDYGVLVIVVYVVTAFLVRCTWLWISSFNCVYVVKAASVV
jgi:hypothetical protein